MLRRLSTIKLSKRLRYEGPHDLEILPNDRWETYQQHWLVVPQSVYTFHDEIGSKAERRSCLELERFLRYTILENHLWQPATSTSAIITLLPKDGIRRRYWVNGTLIGMRYPDGKIKEMCVLVERYPRFPTLKSLEEYVRTRLPYEIMSAKEIRSIARQIDKRFFVVGKTDVYEFELRRRVKYNRLHKTDYSAITLRWQIPREDWGVSTWKAYFLLFPNDRVRFISSRVSCHVDLRAWITEKLPRPWTYQILEKPRQPNLEHPYIPRALTWLMICFDAFLGRRGIVVSFEDDPFSGMPEDVPDVKSIDSPEVRRNLELRPPEELRGILHLHLAITDISQPTVSQKSYTQDGD